MTATPQADTCPLTYAAYCLCRTALLEQHGKYAHAGTFWVASVRSDRALLGTRARRRLIWEKDTHQHTQHQHQATPQQEQPQRVRMLPQGQPVQQAPTKAQQMVASTQQQQRKERK